MRVWAIRDKNTKLFLPAHKGSGFSFDEPTTLTHPRLHFSKKSAQNTLAAWAKGHWICERGTDNGNPWIGEAPEDFEETMPDNTNCQHRSIDNMEIVEFNLEKIICQQQ